MTQNARLIYLSHPQVQIDPYVPITEWPLNDVGQSRIRALAETAPTCLDGTNSVFSSPERKARDAAGPLASALSLEVVIAEDSYENDRSATGYLPPSEFEKTADAFFANPTKSIRGWERAQDAQTRILISIKTMTHTAPPGDILVVGHGAVGSLLYCACANTPISREYDQGPGGGGNVMIFDRANLRVQTHWCSIEQAFEI
ncbi:phosphoglycerate mutase [Tateyamaria omphalii]|uniref:histidine phosphatase family protein n=1 Tax=Tateyamaria omphalii TaxID=299262 RepID=UPI00167190CB|nr:histidine phosphatase family protein [Tateyamaria omphalii]GGX63799.1 phosphoglycerate mutase [Tateyamaria omphalii]